MTSFSENFQEASQLTASSSGDFHLQRNRRQLRHILLDWAKTSRGFWSSYLVSICWVSPIFQSMLLRSCGSLYLLVGPLWRSRCWGWVHATFSWWFQMLTWRQPKWPSNLILWAPGNDHRYAMRKCQKLRKSMTNLTTTMSLAKDYT